MNKPNNDYKSLQVPPTYNEATNLTEKIMFALADLGQGTAEQVIKNLQQIEPDTDSQQLIAIVHETLTQFYEKGFLGATENNGNLVYNIK